MIEDHPAGYRPSQSPKLDFRPEPTRPASTEELRREYFRSGPDGGPPRHGCRRPVRLILFAAFAVLPLVVMVALRAGLFDEIREYGDRRAEESLTRLEAEAAKDRAESPEPDYAKNWVEGHLERGDQVKAMRTAAENDPVLVRRLLEDEGIDANLRLTNEGSSFWSTPLAVAAKAGSAESVSLLLDAGAEVDGKQSDGETALQVASFFGHLEVVERLLSAGADPNLRAGASLVDQTPMELAALRGHVDIILRLHEAGADLRYALHSAALESQTTTVELLLSLDAPTDQKRHGETALELARRYDQDDVVALLEGH